MIWYDEPQDTSLKNNMSVSDILEVCKRLYAKKNAEYQKTDDRFENFSRGAALNQTDRVATLWGYVTKQIVSLASILQHPPYLVPLVNEKALGLYRSVKSSHLPPYRTTLTPRHGCRPAAL